MDPARARGPADPVRGGVRDQVRGLGGEDHVPGALPRLHVRLPGQRGVCQVARLPSRDKQDGRRGSPVVFITRSVWLGSVCLRSLRPVFLFVAAGCAQVSALNLAVVLLTLLVALGPGSWEATMKVLRLVSRRTKVFKSQKHVDVMFALNLFELMRMQVG